MPLGQREDLAGEVDDPRHRNIAFEIAAERRHDQSALDLVAKRLVSVAGISCAASCSAQVRFWLRLRNVSEPQSTILPLMSRRLVATARSKPGR